MKPLGIGFIGLHHQHPRWYYPLWANLPQYRPIAIAEADKAFLASENEFFGLDAHRDYHDLLARNDIDVVAIWLPHADMPQAVDDAARAGKHVIVEKPCAANLDGAKRVLATARQYPKIQISAPYCWRSHPVSVEIMQARRDGLLGDISAVEGRLNAGGPHRYLRDHSPWMLRADQGGGPMWNLGVHWIDFFRWLLDSEVVRVVGSVRCDGGEPARDIEDHAHALLEFANGAVGMLDISYGLQDDYPDKRDLYVGLRGTVGDVAWAPNWEGTSNEWLLVSSHPSAKTPCQRLHVACQDIPGYCGQMAQQWLADFARAVQTGQCPQVTCDDIVANIAVVDAFHRSLKTGAFETVETFA